jgi:hypothetical protein
VTAVVATGTSNRRRTDGATRVSLGAVTFGTEETSWVTASPLTGLAASNLTGFCRVNADGNLTAPALSEPAASSVTALTGSSLRALFQPHPGSSSICIDELDPCRHEGAADGEVASAGINRSHVDGGVGRPRASTSASANFGL